MKFNKHLIALASTALLTTGLAHSADTAATNAVTTKNVRSTPPANTRADRDQLEKKLRAGKSRAELQKILKDNGYRITAINKDEKDYLEYEVVKGQNSHEVQLHFENGSERASEVDIEPNMWRADATKRALNDPNYKDTGTLVADPEGRYSDSRYIKGWTDEKDRLEKALPVNLKAAEYKSKIESMGYKVTALNDREKDYVEYEIAKGENSYEVQIDVDAKTGKATAIDVTNNLWEADATDRATDRAKDRMK